VVEVAGRVLLLGVTDHSITMLEEIIDQERIDKLKQQSVPISTAPSFDSVLQRQLASLQQMSQKFPAIFKDRDNNPDNESEKR
jgi:Flagellar biogenesis protein